MFKWCKDYLSNRRQVTLANNVMSRSNGISHGVPRGSVPGPLLFKMYVNDLQNALGNIDVQLYAQVICIMLVF